MSSVLAQLPALVGVVVGAAGSYAAVALGDRTRFRREQRVRWEERRLTAYAQYAGAHKAVVSVLFRAAAGLGNDPHPHPLAADEAARRLGEASETRDLAWEALLMLGAPEVLEAAHGWAGSAAVMERFVRAGTRDPRGWAALLERQRTARADFYLAVRQDVVPLPGPPGRIPVFAAEPEESP
ncbi:hypothetical protein [Streptomyces sp. NPDC026673]|uniref:hypothetical protein n=1 Tax=Streptomyces sp. NPDC026673 TaxID=3155724 RepID=UPI003404B717